MHKLIICEDHDIVVEGIRLMLSGHLTFTFAGHARNGSELNALLRKEQPAVLLLDLNLKQDDGLALLENLRLLFPELKVLILTMYEEFFLIEKAKKLKANGYLLKNTVTEDFTSALDHVMTSTEFFLPSGLLRKKNNHEHHRDAFVEKMKLTPREVEVIKMIVTGKAAKEMAGELFLSLHTVDTHRKNILKKLQLKNIADLVRFAYDNHLVE